MKNRGYSPWAFSAGVFETPQGKWIARVENGNGFKTISQHDTKEKAEAALEEYEVHTV